MWKLSAMHPHWVFHASMQTMDESYQQAIMKHSDQDAHFVV